MKTYNVKATAENLVTYVNNLPSIYPNLISEVSVFHTKENKEIKIRETVSIFIYKSDEWNIKETKDSFYYKTFTKTELNSTKKIKNAIGDIRRKMVLLNDLYHIMNMKKEEAL